MPLGQFVFPNIPTRDYNLGLLTLNFQTNGGQVGQKNRFVCNMFFWQEHVPFSIIKKKKKKSWTLYAMFITNYLISHKGGEFLLEKNTFHTWKTWFSSLILEIQKIVKIHFKKFTSCMPTLKDEVYILKNA